MSSARLRVLAGGAPASSYPGSPTARRIGYLVFGLSAAALVAGVSYWNAAVERSAIRELPQRRAVYERTLFTIKTTCDAMARPRTLDQYCDEQSRFIAGFPECERECLAAVQRTHRFPAPR
jgi:hypothetical protein